MPTLAASLLAYSDSNPDALPREARERVRIVTSTGATLAPRLSAGLRALFPAARIFAMYGLTECKRVSYLEPDLIDAEPTSVGRPMPNVEVWVVDAEDRRLGPNQVGRLVVRGSNVAVGYWKDPVRTATTFRKAANEERLLFTNDLFRIDERGFLFYVGRTDDVVKVAGYQLSIGDLEAELAALIEVVEAAVVAVPHDAHGHDLTAFVVLREACSWSSADLRREISRRAESSALVPRHVRLVPALPRTANEKIDRQALLLLAKQGEPRKTGAESPVEGRA